MSHTKLISVAPATLLLALIGCADGQPKSDDKVEFEADPERFQAALETPILDCQAAHSDCDVNAASIDDRITCNDELSGCLREAADRAQSVADGVHACREQGRACADDGGDRETCRAEFEACADAALRGGGNADAGTADDGDEPVVEVDGGALDAGTPTKPGLPSLPLPSLPGLGGVDAGAGGAAGPSECLIELRLCLSLDLTAAADCANTARLCLQLP